MASWVVYMSSSSKKKLLSLILVVVILLCAAGAWGFRYFNSTDYQIQQATKALKDNDFDSFKEICPEFNNGKKINKEMFALFRTSFPKKISEKAVADRLLNKEGFNTKNEQSWFEKTTFTAKPRYVYLETEEADTKVIVSVKNQLLETKKDKIGPFLAGKYKLSLALNSPLFGKTQLDKQENLLKEHAHEEIIEEELYLKQADFQKGLLNQVVNYYTSFNECLEDNLKFTNLAPTTDENKIAYQETYDLLRPYLQEFSQEFQYLAMSPDSMKIKRSFEPVITFDLYIDQRVSIKFTKEMEIDEDVINESKNAVVTMRFDSETGQWLVDDIDHETFNQDPKDWANIQDIKLKAPNKAIWSADKSNSAI
jgi:hypothetical protein